jgi:hypothetical protein
LEGISGIAFAGRISLVIVEQHLERALAVAALA